MQQKTETSREVLWFWFYKPPQEVCKWCNYYINFKKAASDKISFSNVFHVVSLRRHWHIVKSDHGVIWAVQLARTGRNRITKICACSLFRYPQDLCPISL